MELHHLQHIVRTAAALIDVPQVIIAGQAAAMKSVKNPTNRWRERYQALDVVDLLIYENNDPQGCVLLLEEAIGHASLFHQRYGYYVRSCVSWEAPLPPGWSNRLSGMNMVLRSNPLVLALNPADLILTNLVTHPDPLFNIELLQNDLTTVDILADLIDEWNLPGKAKNQARIRLNDLVGSMYGQSYGADQTEWAGQPTLAADNIISIVRPPRQRQAR